ncbi:MAG: glycosyltransferase family 9 protein, partial [Phycisphaerae bacterium]|nr:glycosyltransferase family 9 protein [Phycisphaerae bacterium]
MDQLAGRSFRRILLIKPSSPGDILHALPVARGLRAAFPESHLAWLVASSFADLLEVEPSIDEVIRFDRKRYGRMWRSAAAFRAFVAFVRDLRARQFDLVVDLQGLFRSGFLSWVSRAGTRIGFRDAREAAWMFYTHRLPRRPHATHAADRNLAVLNHVGRPRIEPDLRPVFSAADAEAARALLTQTGIGPQDDYVVLVPSTRWETKRWPAERFGTLAARLGCRPLACDGAATMSIPSAGDRRGTMLRAVLVGGRDDTAAAEAG